MIERLSLLAVGGLIGMIVTIIIFRKDIIQYINYNDGLPDLDDIEAMPPTNPMIEKSERLKNLRWHLAHVEKTKYPGEYRKLKRETITALRRRIYLLQSDETN